MVFGYSFWWIFPAILFASAVAFLKFRKLSGLPDIPRGIIWLIAILRFSVVFLLLVLLLNPALSVLHHWKEKPLLVVAQDNSVSVLKNKDSLYYRQDYRTSLEKACSDLEDKFDVVRLTFGAAVRRNGDVDFTDNRSDIAAVLEYADRHFVARQPEAMVLLTDGIYNAGVNPRYCVPDFPLYTVGLGDTVIYPDAYIRSVEVNKFNFWNTVFPLKAEIAAQKQKGRKMTCRLRENGKKIDEREIVINQDNFLSEISFEIETKQKGIIRYEIELETEFTERTLENNRVETWVNVIDNSANIAIFASAPHPDVAAIVNAVDVSGIYHCKLHHYQESWDTLKANLIILHNPDPEDQQCRKLIEEANRRRISLWYILTGRKNITNFSRFDTQYQVNLNSDLNEYATIQVNSDFPYFEFTPEETAGFAKYPPLTVPFGEINPLAGRTLFTQAVKNTVTRNGMIAFYEKEGNREAYLWGEGLWRWRLYSYQENGSHKLFNTLIHKIIGYLATQRGGERLVHDIKPIYEETEETVIHVELYNDSYELLNEPEMKLELVSNGKNFSYSLNRDADKYRINLGNLPAGEYSWHLSADLKGEPFSAKGTFYVRSHNPELNNVVADRQLLRELATHSGGRYFDVGEQDRLVCFLKENSELKPVYKSETEFMDLSRMKLLGLVLLLLLCVEWFLLRYYAD